MGSPTRSRLSRALTTVAIFLLGASALVPVPGALADTSPRGAGEPVTVSSDALPTPQINGVVWSQVIAGGVVYVAGDFTSARPAGSAPGVNETPRKHLLAYDVASGALLPWAPAADAQVRALALAPDGRRLYAAGDFVTIDGLTRKRVAAFDLPSGSLSATFVPTVNNTVYAIAATNTTVYFGGPFTSVSQQPRSGTAAVSAATGKATAWNAVIGSGRVFALTISPDGSKVVIGGSFQSLNGSANPGYGLGMVDSITGATLAFAANAVVRNGGAQSAVFSLTSDAEAIYGTGYVYRGNVHNLEGTFRADWNGTLTWIADCHGDEYSVALHGDAVYVAGHAHTCANIGSFPDAVPADFHRAIAFSKRTTGVNTYTVLPNYTSFWGTPAPSNLNWYPDINAGTFTGQGQGPWSVAANADYVVYGGEFTQVNSTKQQGLVRFAVKASAPNLDGPRLTGDNLKPTLVSEGSTSMTVSWPADWDRDNETLTYFVYRDGKTGTPAYTTTVDSRFWDRPTISWTDTGLVPGSAHTYRIRAVDPSDNSGWGSTVSGTVAAQGTQSAYSAAVIADQPTSFWRLGGAAAGSLVKDTVGRTDLIAGAGVSHAASGPIAGDATAGAAFDGTSRGRVSSGTAVWRDNSFSIETWINTTSTAGGKIVDFGNSPVGASTENDRVIYMTAKGTLVLGLFPRLSIETIASPGRYNDGRWHHVVASLGAAGMQLYVDGAKVAANPAVTNGWGIWGYWGIGGDTIAWSTDADFFAGSIADTAIYPAPLSDAQVLRHWTLSGRA